MTARPRVDRVHVHWDWEAESQEADNQQFCYASADVSYKTDLHDNRRLETLTSAGLGGIDPASDRLYKREVEDDQYADLRDHLRHFGIRVTHAQWARLIQEART